MWILANTEGTLSGVHVASFWGSQTGTIITAIIGLLIISINIGYGLFLSQLFTVKWFNTVEKYHGNNQPVWASLAAQLVKNPPAMQETPIQFLGWKDPLEKG